MTGTKLSDLAAITLAADADLLHVVNDTSGTPTNKKITVENLRNTNTINVLSYGADRTGVYDSTSSIQAAITAAAATVTLGAGAETGTEGVNWGPSIVYLPAGTYQITSTLLIPNGVGLCGAGARSTNLRVHSDWGADTIFIDCENGGVGVASYHQRFDHLGVTLSDNATIKTGIHTSAWQENAGLYDFIMRQVHEDCTGLLVDTGTGGSARLGRMEDITFFGDMTNESVAAMHFNSPTGLLVNIQNSTIIGFKDGIKAASSTRLFLNSAHFEICTDNVSIEDSAICTAVSCRSHSSSVNGFHIEGENNRVRLINCVSDGLTAHVYAAGAQIIGDVFIPDFSYPHEVTKASTAGVVTVVGSPAVINISGDGGTDISSFVGYNDGDSFMVHFNASATVDFTGTSMRGNSGVDKTFAFGDWMWVTQRSGNWYCLLGDSTA